MGLVPLHLNLDPGGTSHHPHRARGSKRDRLSPAPAPWTEAVPGTGRVRQLSELNEGPLSGLALLLASQEERARSEIRG